MRSYNLSFISDNNLFNHVKETMEKYSFNINLIKFNSNLIDPIKLTFDKMAYNKEWKDVIESEVYRQIDKSNTNHIGYFHQNIFKYFNNCEVPKEGWDVIFDDVKNKKKYYVEMKNKHNTMNYSSSSKTYMNMQNHLLTSLDKDISICSLVEVIATNSQNIPWVITLNKTKMVPNERLRRISIDKFYEIVTGEREAFKNLCAILPIVMEDVFEALPDSFINNTVYSELILKNSDILKSIYKLAFSSYLGF